MRFRILSLFAGLCAVGNATAQQPDPPPAVFPAASDADAWAKLPPRKNPPLPEWARVLAATHPKTTAKMLELDYLHRDNNPLGTELAAAVRWAAADALKSEPGKAIAAADLRRAGVPPRLFPKLSTPESLSPDARLATAFARKLTLEGFAISDKEFAEVLKHFGPEKTTALVHSVAYANFHNRILLGFGAECESPPAPPVAVAFDPDAKVESPKRPPWDDLKSITTTGPAVRVEWSDRDFAALNKTLEGQKERTLRIPLPDESKLATLTGRDKEQADRIVWMAVSSGYQPEMTRAWFACLNAFYTESNPDRVFTNSVFWVVTRTNDCFY